MSPRLLWNTLVPWRRRRRYYFLAVLSRLQDPELAIPAEQWPVIFNASPAQFAEFVAGRQLPRLFIQSLAILAYKVPPPSRSYVFAPIVGVAGVAIATAGALLLR